MRPLPINLPSALQLARVRALDIAVAGQRLQVATAQLSQANVLWLPTVAFGGDYYRQNGLVQTQAGPLMDTSKSSAMVGLGAGIGNAAVIPINDAIFAPLSARQVVRARQADVQSATNDSILAVAEAYFSVQQARGELAGAIDASARTVELARRTEKLAAGLVSPVEVVRAQAESARRQEAEFSARERWRVAGADLLRVLDLPNDVQVEPLEPPFLNIVLVDAALPLDELLAMAFSNRPELASQQALVQATIAQLKQERFRPFVPSLIISGTSTNPAGTLGYGLFGGGPGNNLSGFGSRADVDFQLLWQLDNLGFGNRARIDTRRAENGLAQVEFLRLRDRIAAEVAQALAQAELAAKRRDIAEGGLRLAIQSAEMNLTGMGQTRRVGEFVALIIRPQEAVASVQALGQAYIDYYGAVADANRAQFRLYRALGRPADWLLAQDKAVDCSTPLAQPNPGRQR
jgi:outer membrane protein TolC